MAQDDTGERSNGVQSVEVGLALFRVLLAQEHAVSLSELARMAGMHRAKAHRYLASFSRAGWVSQHAESGHYDLGPAVRDMALAWLGRQDPLQSACIEAQNLSQALGETCFIAIWGSGGATAIRVFQPPRSVAIGVTEGAVFDPLSSATGRVFAAWRDAHAQDPRLAHSQEAVLEQIRRLGVACAYGDHVQGINAVSAPVLDAQGHLSLAITVVGPASSLDAAFESPAAQALLVVSRRLSAGLGYRGR
ncbi:IclR family transcriptional regulator [Alcaligenaceae bacterium CGII-47]|nr:IclR family transcriptional regulator [Alcaligenaceae bacterium CGII-47]